MARARIYLLPVGIFGVSMAMAVFPPMARAAADSNLAELKRLLVAGLKKTLFLSIPSSLGMILIARNCSRWSTSAAKSPSPTSNAPSMLPSSSAWASGPLKPRWSSCACSSCSEGHPHAHPHLPVHDPPEPRPQPHPRLAAEGGRHRAGHHHRRDPPGRHPPGHSPQPPRPSGDLLAGFQRRQVAACRRRHDHDRLAPAQLPMPWDAAALNDPALACAAKSSPPWSSSPSWSPPAAPSTSLLPLG